MVYDILLDWDPICFPIIFSIYTLLPLLGFPLWKCHIALFPIPSYHHSPVALHQTLLWFKNLSHAVGKPPGCAPC